MLITIAYDFYKIGKQEASKTCGFTLLAILLDLDSKEGSMMLYDHLRSTGGTYFCTLTTRENAPLFQSFENILLLNKAFCYTQIRYPFHIDAFVFLPDHMHCLLTLPFHDQSFTTRWTLIKALFKKQFFMQNKIPCSHFQNIKENLLQDDNEYKNYLDYIHFNPVKHRLAAFPKEWQHSSFQSYVKKGVYALDWSL